MLDKKTIMTRADYIENLLNEKNYQDIGTHLAYLETVDMTVNYLQETAVAKAVYRVLKNCPSMLLKNKAKHLLSKWKILYKNHCCQLDFKAALPANAKNGIEHLQVVLENKNSSETLTQHEVSDPTNPSSCLPFEKVPGDKESNVRRDDASQPTLLEPPSSFRETSPHGDHTTAMRSKCRELIYGILSDSSTNDEEIKKCHKLAEEIEQHIFALHLQNNRKYKNCIRSKVSNLKNPKNSHLKHSLLTETLSPKEFAEMSVMEMASDELKQLRASYTESSVKEHQLPQNVSGTHTNKIKCRRCENFNCIVTVIARGALFLPSWVRNTNPDEQTMTYVICNECGEQWYHSRWICF